MAKNKKPTAQPKGAPAPKGSGKPTTTKPAPAPKENPVCPRCYPNMDPFSDGGTNHKISKCSLGTRHREDDKIHRLWPHFSDKGSDKDKVESQKDAENLLELISNNPTQYKGKKITKYLLEHAFRVLYDDLKNTLPKNPTTNTASDGKNTPTQKGNTAASGLSKPSGTSNSSQFPAQSSPNQYFDLQPPPQKSPSQQSRPEYEYAVHHQCNLDNSFVPETFYSSTARRGDRLLVATNYVAVKKVPAKLHVYSVTCGNIESLNAQQDADKDDGPTTSTKKEATEDEQLAADASKLSVSDSPAADSPGGRKPAQRSEKSRIFKGLAGRSELEGIQWATDYALFWTIQPLQLMYEKECTLRDIEYTKLSGRKYKLAHITFTYLHQLDFGPSSKIATTKLLNQEANLNVSGSSDRQAQMRITALNAMISKRVSENDNLIPIGPNKFFFKDQFSKIDSLLNIRQGYFTSVHPGCDSVLLNINVATSAFYNPIPLHVVFRTYQRQEEAQSALKGLTVWIAYRRGQHDASYDPNLEEHRRRIVAGFGRPPHQEEFELDGKDTTVAAYFQSLGHDIQYPKLPCISVNVAPSRDQDANKSNDAKDDKKAKPSPQWIPPELLYIEPYQPYGKLLPPSLTEKMIEKAVRAPSVNQDKIIHEGFDLLGIRPNSGTFLPLQLDVGHKLLQVPATKLPTPAVLYRGGATADVRQASWNVAHKIFALAPEGGPKIAHALEHAVCTIDLRSKHIASKTPRKDLGQLLSRRMDSHGIQFSDGHQTINTTHKCIELPYIDWHDDIAFQNQLQEALKKCESRLAVVILDEKDIDRYGVVKRVCDQWMPLHTVCVTQKKLKRGPVDDQLLSNLALKFNIKLRGQNHRVCKPQSKTSAFSSISKDTIVFGADVSHAGTSMPNTPSVAAVVASEDGEFAKFSASMRLQASKQEMIEELRGMVEHRLRRYYEQQNHLPSKILFFRDGVSEDQYDICKHTEIEQIKRAYQSVLNETSRGNAKTNRDSCVQLTFVIVGKRHNTRFYATNDNQTYPNSNKTKGLKPKQPITETKWSNEWSDEAGEYVRVKNDVELKYNGNIQPGLLVEDVVTRPKTQQYVDFFLQSHAALQGTARAGHYVVIQPGAFSIQEIQDLTHAFCYNYARATKGVSYVGPAYYADRLCERGTHYLKGYTGALTEEPIPMSPEDKRDSDKKAAAKRYAKEIADHISKSAVWNPPVNKQDPQRERNPWHPDFDNSMFWL